MSHHLWLSAALVFAVIAGARCLRNVTLKVDPEAVERGHEAVLRCYYDLEGAPLYSLKWYRGRYEFYRYTPNEHPSMKIFPTSGIEVDPDNSNESQVTIRNVDYSLSGNFSCEVTADAPTFSTAFVTKKLTVVSLPEGKPIIVSERERYDPGDVLKANCSLPPSKPPTNFSFTLNNVPVGRQKHREPERGESANVDPGLQWSELNLHLQPSHYVNGQLNLRCIAEIPGIYTLTSEVQLGGGLREPVPERVTSENGCPAGAMASSVPLFCLSVAHLLLR